MSLEPIMQTIALEARSEMDRMLSSNRWCRHWRGTFHHNTCKAGVPYDSVKGVLGPDGLPIACLSNHQDGAPICARRSFLSDEEAWANILAARGRVTEFLGKLASMICPECDQPVERQKQVGRCVYAEPCGHRLFQGKKMTNGAKP